MNIKKIAMKYLLKILSILTISASLYSCNKEIDPIVLTGSWELDTLSVIVNIVYNPQVAEEYPNTLIFLEKNKHNLRRELMKPQRIVFKAPNVSEFYYNDVPLPVTGTYLQESAYFVIHNTLFSDGILGASDNLRLELYYSKDRLMQILFNFLTNEDDSQETFSRLIEQFNGIGSYKKAI